MWPLERNLTPKEFATQLAKFRKKSTISFLGIIVQLQLLSIHIYLLHHFSIFFPHCQLAALLATFANNMLFSATFLQKKNNFFKTCTIHVINHYLYTGSVCLCGQKKSYKSEGNSFREIDLFLYFTKIW